MSAFVFLGGRECGDVKSVVMFGVTLPLGVPVEVTEARAVQKLRHNIFFEEVASQPEADMPTGSEADAPPVEKKRRGRPPRV